MAVYRGVREMRNHALLAVGPAVGEELVMVGVNVDEQVALVARQRCVVVIGPIQQQQEVLAWPYARGTGRRIGGRGGGLSRLSAHAQ
jgi:hypothetical protein